MRILSSLILLFFFLTSNYGQEEYNFQTIIEEIGSLENVKDPKCHATAARLEDFMYGTPLSSDARNARIEFQQNFTKHIWLAYSRRLNDINIPDAALFKEIESTLIRYSEYDTEVVVTFSTSEKIIIDNNDLRQYSSVAYALRAILSVQQAYLFEDEKLASLSNEALKYFKNSIDLAVLSVLKKADEYSRKEMVHEIEAAHINQAIAVLFPSLILHPENDSNSASRANEQRAILESIIAQKIESFQQYNQVNQSVFLRNIQVYFSRVPWPKEKAESDSLKIYFTETLIQFSKDLLLMSQSFALKNGRNRIEYMDAYQSVQVYLPHEITYLEDVIFFPLLDRPDQITIEAYDFDAFRDSGWHWQYILSAFKDKTMRLGVAPDPFALEMIAEGIAQFAVLFFRVAGTHAIENNQSTLLRHNLIAALNEIQHKITSNSSKPEKSTSATAIISSEKTSNSSTSPFIEITNEIGIDFQHRSADWLARLIRGYVVKEDENLARLSIPPAFGGSGVAAEDIDNDGWVDILLLGGAGNKLLKNEQGESFKDITQSAGLEWQLSDGTKAEPRQPIIADFDNDGLQDIFISYVNANHRLYKNKGDGKFQDMTSSCRLGGEGLIGGPATALDFNNDGLLDLYIGYFGNYLEGELPTLRRRNTNGSPNKLFLNEGDFRFKEVTNNSGIDNKGWTQAVGHSDINGDGWQDIIVGNDFGTNSYYINQKDGSFIDMAFQLETDKPSYTMGIGISDLNGDQRPDFYISNIVVMEKDDKYVLPTENTKQHFDLESLSRMRVVEANDLFLSVNNSEKQLLYASSDKIGRGYSSTGWSWDADFFDYDLDGDDDLYCLTGMNPYSVYGTNNDYYKSPEEETKEVEYAQSQGDRNLLFENKNGFLERKENTGGLDYLGTSRSAAYFDFDNDGDLDIVTNEYHGGAKLFQNNAPVDSVNWLKLKLVSESDRSTKDAIGAIVQLTTTDGHTQWKELHSTTGYLSCHPKILHFGLGRSTNCTIKIFWPNGESQVLETDRINTLMNIIQKKSIDDEQE